MQDHIIRRLVPTDAEAYRALRIEALSTSAHTFAEEPASARARSVEDYALQLAPDADGWMFGAFVGDRLVGMAGMTAKKAPFEHIAKIGSVYVAADAREGGIAASLFLMIESAARRRGIFRLTLSVAIQNVAARRFYDRRGYEPYGVEPCAMRIGGMYVDEELRGKFLSVPIEGQRIVAPSFIDLAKAHRRNDGTPSRGQTIPGIEAGLAC